MYFGVCRSSRSSSVNDAWCVVAGRLQPDVAAAVGLEVDRRLLDRLVGPGVDRDARALDRADVAQPLDAAVGEAGVIRVVVVDPLDGDRRRGDDRHGIVERAGVAGFDPIAQILRDAGFGSDLRPAGFVR